jgi:hypothetical protein
VLSFALHPAQRQPLGHGFACLVNKVNYTAENHILCALFFPHPSWAVVCMHQLAPLVLIALLVQGSCRHDILLKYCGLCAAQG